MVTDTLIRVLLSRAARRDAILASTQDRIEAWWRMTDPWDGDQVQAFTEAAADLARAGQDAMVSLAVAAQLSYLRELDLEMDAYFPEVAPEVRLFNPDEVSEHAPEPKPVVSGGRETLRLPATEVFNRPARQYRAQVSRGTAELEALAESISRVRIITGTNLSLAEREAEHLMLTEAARQGLPVIGYRRVIHPELSKSGVCGLCLAASDRKYSVAELKPIHDNCKCETMPITESGDPGNELNRADLDRLYQDAGSTNAADLKSTRYRIDAHGELQSVLVPQRRGTPVPRYRSPGSPAPTQLAPDEKDREFAARHLPTMRQILAQSLANGRAEDSGPVQYQRAQIARFEAILAAA
ncbi:hypothetical protein IU485_27980 [Nocardia cyriacigeorgica]|uniref:hypothetical protein n=1 Tax=Nocardia cyriacigeorgica TaxID=135487 RepID=UPI0018948722|nr:hypothetical protein [Nocardia cyriacigeorgica]MBF6085212.1 hypothetical protein [Nocardia cyriacigeorgica]